MLKLQLNMERKSKKYKETVETKNNNFISRTVKIKIIENNYNSKSVI